MSKKTPRRMDVQIKAVDGPAQTITLEEWHRRHDDADEADVHFVRPQALGGHRGVE